MFEKQTVEEKWVLFTEISFEHSHSVCDNGGIVWSSTFLVMSHSHIHIHTLKTHCSLKICKSPRKWHNSGESWKVNEVEHLKKKKKTAIVIMSGCNLSHLMI